MTVTEPVHSCDLATMIETRLLGVAPDDQDLVLEDDDWRTIIAALRERDRLREALGQIKALGSDGEHSGDRHARCRDIARAALEGQSDD